MSVAGIEKWREAIYRPEVLDELWRDAQRERRRTPAMIGVMIVMAALCLASVAYGDTTGVVKLRSVGAAISQAEYESDTAIYVLGASPGDVVYWHPSGYLYRLALGSTGTLLSSGGSAPEWTTWTVTQLAATPTLDQVVAAGNNTSPTGVVNYATTATAAYTLSDIAGTSAIFVRSGGGLGVYLVSADRSDRIDIHHDNTDGYLKWSDGVLIAMTDEGTDGSSWFVIKGKGGGAGYLEVKDGSNASYEGRFYQLEQTTYLSSMSGTLRLQSHAGWPVDVFGTASSGETRELFIYGYRAGDALRSLGIGCGTDVADSASFDGLGNYLFDGNLMVGGLSAPSGRLHLKTTSGATTQTIEAAAGQGDAVTRYLITGAGEAVIGIDNDDGDKFKAAMGPDFDKDVMFVIDLANNIVELGNANDTVNAFEAIWHNGNAEYKWSVDTDELTLTDVSNSTTVLAISVDDVTFHGDVTVENIHDMTPAWPGTGGEALEAVGRIGSSGGRIDHSTLPRFGRAWTSRTLRLRSNRRADFEREAAPNGFEVVGELVSLEINPSATSHHQAVVVRDERNIGAMLTVALEAIGELGRRNAALEARLARLE